MASNKKNTSSYISYGVVGVVLLVIIAGFLLIESPKKARLRKFDEKRVQDLQVIQSQILDYWRTKGKLPRILTDLNDDISGFRAPHDPMTNVEYEYAVGGADSFSLCAMFSLASDEEKNVIASKPLSPYNSIKGNEVWGHGWGQTCYDRTIDKERYKPYPIPVEKGM